MKCAILRATQTFQALTSFFCNSKKNVPTLAEALRFTNQDMCIQTYRIEKESRSGLGLSKSLSMGVVLRARPDKVDDVTATAIAHPTGSLYAALKYTPKGMERRRPGPIQVN